MDASPPEKHNDLYSSDEHDTDDPTEHDRNVLEKEEEQQEKLLNKSRNQGNRSGHDDKDSVKHGRRAQKKERRRLLKGTRSKNGTTDEEGKLLYEMEEGGSRDDLSSLSSSSAELDKLKDQPSESSKVRSHYLVIPDQSTHSSPEATESSKHQRFLAHHRLVPPSCLRLVPDVVQERPKAQSFYPLERHVFVRSYHYPHIARWIPSRLHPSQHHACSKLVHSQRCLTKIHASKLSERHLPQPLYSGDRSASRKSRGGGEQFLGSRSG